MRFETLMRTLLLGAVLIAGPALAAEVAGPAERLSGDESASRPAAASDVSNSQQRRAGKTWRKNDDRKATADTTATLKKTIAPAGDSTGDAGEAIPGNIPADEPPHLALRGVRG